MTRSRMNSIDTEPKPLPLADVRERCGEDTGEGPCLLPKGHLGQPPRGWHFGDRTVRA